MIFKRLKTRFLYIFSDSAFKYFKNEQGGHKFHRIPPTESKGRVHTSTVIVTVTKIDEFEETVLDKKDIKRITTRGSGAGGQHKNKVETCVVLKHLKTGIQVRIDATRSQIRNYNLALAILTNRVNSFNKKIREDKDKSKKKNSGKRSESKRVYNFKQDVVKDYTTNKSMSLKKFFKGNIANLS